MSKQHTVLVKRPGIRERDQWRRARAEERSDGRLIIFGVDEDGLLVFPARHIYGRDEWDEYRVRKK